MLISFDLLSLFDTHMKDISKKKISGWFITEENLFYHGNLHTLTSRTKNNFTSYLYNDIWNIVSNKWKMCNDITPINTIRKSKIKIYQTVRVT